MSAIFATKQGRFSVLESLGRRGGDGAWLKVTVAFVAGLACAGLVGNVVGGSSEPRHAAAPVDTEKLVPKAKKTKEAALASKPVRVIRPDLVQTPVPRGEVGVRRSAPGADDSSADANVGATERSSSALGRDDQKRPTAQGSAPAAVDAPAASAPAAIASALPPAAPFPPRKPIVGAEHAGAPDDDALGSPPPRARKSRREARREARRAARERRAERRERAQESRLEARERAIEARLEAQGFRPVGVRITPDGRRVTVYRAVRSSEVSAYREARPRLPFFGMFD